jgi:retinitis pigmentosa 9 protein
MSIDDKAADELALITRHNANFAQEGEDFVIEEPRPEDAIPDLPENHAAREFLRKAPKVGLHMPLGKEVKVMQCFRCKIYGHRLIPVSS